MRLLNLMQISGALSEVPDPMASLVPATGRWFRSSDGLTYDGGNLVTAWADRSANAANLTPIGTGPTRVAADLNSKDVARFAQPDKRMTGTSTSFSTSAPFSAFFVAKCSNYINYPSGFTVPMESYAFVFMGDAGGGSYMGNINFAYTAPLAAVNNWAWYVMTYNGNGYTTLSNHKFYKNGVEQSISTIGQGNAANNYSMGGYDGIYGWVGDIADLLIAPGNAFTASDITTLATYVSDQYGL